MIQRVSVKVSVDQRPPWRPTPEAFAPPNGMCGSSLTDEQLMSDDLVEWLEGDPFWLVIAYNTFDHYPRHGGRIAEWMKKNVRLSVTE